MVDNSIKKLREQMAERDTFMESLLVGMMADLSEEEAEELLKDHLAMLDTRHAERNAEWIELLRIRASHMRTKRGAKTG